MDSSNMRNNDGELSYYSITGAYYGYPKCCVQEYERNSRSGWGHPESQRVVGEHTGFIPCTDHSVKLLAGEIELKDLIKDRFCPSPFPYSVDGAASAFVRQVKMDYELGLKSTILKKKMTHG